MSGAGPCRRSATTPTRPGWAGGSPATPCWAAAGAGLAATGCTGSAADRAEIGIRGGWPGALAEQVAVPVTALRQLPGSVDAEAGALAEPGGSALRAVQAAAIAPGDRVLVLGPGTIGLLAAQFALAADAEVHVLGQTPESVAFAAALGVAGAWTAVSLPSLRYDAVIDCSNDADLPALALDLDRAR